MTGTPLPPNVPSPVSYPGIDGFLGTRGSLMLDVIVIAMALVLPILAWSIYLVRVRRDYNSHKWFQIVLGSVLLVAVLVFEIDIRMHGWRERAAASPYYESLVFPSFYVHLGCAIPALFLWIYVIVQALRRFDSPPLPSAHSPEHRLWGWAAAVAMTLTALTGWIFYYLAFVA